jgi:hypothetical protein
MSSSLLIVSLQGRAVGSMDATVVLRQPPVPAFYLIPTEICSIHQICQGFFFGREWKDFKGCTNKL